MANGARESATGHLPQRDHHLSGFWKRLDYLTAVIARLIAIGGFVVVLVALLTDWVDVTLTRIVNARVQTGTITLSRQAYPALRDGPFPRGGEYRERGIREERVAFEVPFTAAPKVIAMLSGLDVDHEWNTRINLRIDEVDERGFTYSFVTWSNTRLYQAEAHWVALAQTPTD